MTGPAGSRLVLVAHGTRSPQGRAVVDDLVRQIAGRLPEVEVSCAYVDVQEPRVEQAVVVVPAGRPLVVLPLLLSRGYHVQTDVADAVAARPGTVTSPALGPDPALVPVLLDRLAQAGATPTDPCVLVGAGSRLPEAGADVARMAALLAAARPGAVGIGYCAAAEPTVAQAVSQLSGAGPVTVLPYLLAPGHFLTALARAGAHRVAAPLGADPRVADLACERARAGLAALP